jgi:hypothetical protein
MPMPALVFWMPMPTYAIMSDRGVQFSSALWGATMQKLGIKYLLTTVSADVFMWLVCIETEVLMRSLIFIFLFKIQCLALVLFTAYNSTLLRVSLLERDDVEGDYTVYISTSLSIIYILNTYNIIQECLYIHPLKV